MLAAGWGAEASQGETATRNPEGPACAFPQAMSSLPGNGCSLEAGFQADMASVFIEKARPLTTHNVYQNNSQ